MWLKATFFCLQKHYDPLRGRPWPQPLAPWPANHLCGDSGDSYSIPVSIPCCTHFCWFNPYVRRLNPILHQNSFQWMISPFVLDENPIHVDTFFAWFQTSPILSRIPWVSGWNLPGMAKHAAPSASSHPSGFWPAKVWGNASKKWLGDVGGIMVGNQESIVMKVNKNGLTDWSRIDENEIKWIRMDESRTLGPQEVTSWWCLLLGETNGWVVLYCWAQLQ